MKWTTRRYNYKKPEENEGMISIILPTYNRIDFLKDRVNEILKQTYTNWELIIINDNSSDETFNYINSLSDNRIKKINLPQNTGCVSLPRNIGVSWSSGEFICNADDDVAIPSNKLELLISNITNKLVCIGQRKELTINNEIKISPIIKEWNPDKGSGIDNGQFIYRKSAYSNMPYITSTHACDYHLLKELYKHGEFTYIDDIVCCYIWHGGNRSLSEERKYKLINPYTFKKYFNVINDLSVIYEL